MKCPVCGKEYIIKNLTGTTVYHGKVIYLNNAKLIVDKDLGLVCEDCFKEINKELEKE
jgi:hypothetical protein